MRLGGLGVVVSRLVEERLFQDVSAKGLHYAQASLSFESFHLITQPYVQSHRRLDQIYLPRAHQLRSHPGQLQPFKLQFVQFGDILGDVDVADLVEVTLEDLGEDDTEEVNLVGLKVDKWIFALFPTDVL